jgi:hypothetical protein
MSHRASIGWVVGWAALAAGCSSSSPDAAAAAPDAGIETLADLPHFDVPPGGMAFYTPILRGIQPGADVTYCTFTDTITQEDMLIHTTGGVQSPHGHHALLFYAPIPETPRTTECGSVDMERFRQLIGGTGGEGELFWTPPPNVGTRVPKGVQFVVQTHWINTTAAPIDVQGAMYTVPMTKGPDTITAGTVAVVNTSFSIPAHAKLEKSTECTFDVDHQLLMAVPHEHEWGTHVTVDVHRADGKVDPFIDTPFQPEYVAHPPVAKPMLIHKGDRVKLTCDWDNTTGSSLEFPREMCVVFGFAKEDDDAVCSDGQWDHSVLGGLGGAADAGTGPHCVPYDAAGNALGVGRYCSKGGGQCLQNGGGNATICAIDYDSDPNSDSTFCTKVCQDDASCGPGAVCAGDKPGAATKGCVPLSCAPAWAKDGGG